MKLFNLPTISEGRYVSVALEQVSESVMAYRYLPKRDLPWLLAQKVEVFERNEHLGASCVGPPPGVAEGASSNRTVSIDIILDLLVVPVLHFRLVRDAKLGKKSLYATKQGNIGVKAGFD